MSIWNPFNWGKTQDQNKTPVRISPRRPQQRDYTDGLTVNKALTRGLYFGEYEGIKLASALALAPVDVPANFMGLPLPRLSDEEDSRQEVLMSIHERWSLLIPQIHKEKRRDGTIWVFPRYDSKRGFVDLEIIPDDTVTDIVRDLLTGEVIRIYTSEDIKVSTGRDETAVIERVRMFTDTRIDVSYKIKTGVLDSDLKDRSMRNPAGIMPIPFSQSPDADEIRGHSVYGRIISDMKDYADLDRAQVMDLAKFAPKLLAGVQDVEKFARNQGYDSYDKFLDDFSLYETDFIAYLKEVEAPPELLELTSSAGAYSEALKRKYRKVVEGSGIPEIAWGLKTEGNMASVEENMATLMMYVRGDQREVTEAWKQVFTAALRLELRSSLQDPDFDLSITWDDLDSLSDKTKSEIFRNFAEGLSKMINVGALTKEQLHKLWLQNFPNLTTDDFKLFVEGLRDMAAYRSFVNANYADQLAAAGASTGSPEDI
jgi:hypothetical protein